jgi:membrane protein YdbS with pleckstrin-like domain
MIWLIIALLVTAVAVAGLVWWLRSHREITMTVASGHLFAVGDVVNVDLTGSRDRWRVTCVTGDKLTLRRARRIFQVRP